MDKILNDEVLQAVSGGAVHYISYTVREGDTLGTIAGDYGTTVNFLAGINRMPCTFKIKPGMKILVPA